MNSLVNMPQEFLQKIIAYKRQELEGKRRKHSLKDVQLMAADVEPARAFLKNFKSPVGARHAVPLLNIIAEIKKASPSAGVIRADFNPVELATMYEDNGAVAVSVLTDEHFFQGHLDHLKEVRSAIQLPLLRKDFTLHEYHIYQGRAYGADAILLIAAILDDHQLKDYQKLISELGMTALVEVHSQNELDHALKQNTKLIGINNRNLNDFSVKIETTLELLKHNELEVSVISESGLTDHKTLVELSRAGVAGFLIGEALLKEKNPGTKLRDFLEGEDCGRKG